MSSVSEGAILTFLGRACPRISPAVPAFGARFTSQGVNIPVLYFSGQIRDFPILPKTLDLQNASEIRLSPGRGSHLGLKCNKKVQVVIDRYIALITINLISFFVFNIGNLWKER